MGEKEVLVRVVGWSLVIIGIILLFLIVIGVVHSPQFESVALIISVGFSLLLSEVTGVRGDVSDIKDEISKIRERLSGLESKVELIWKDFKDRKEL